MALPTAVDHVLLQIAEEAAAIPAIAMHEIVPVLQQARREAAQGLRKWLKTAKDAEQRFTAQQYRNAIAQLDEALATVEKLKPAMFKGLQKANQRAAMMAPEHIQRELRTFSMHFGGTSIHIPATQALQIHRGDKVLMKRFASSAARYAGEVGNDIRRELAVGMLKHETVGQLSARLQRLGGVKGKVATSGIAGDPDAITEHIAEGLFRRYGYWAERLARSEISAVYNQHADDSIAEAHKIDPRIQRLWNAAADKRLCPECRSLDGKVADVGKPFPGGYDAPPAHPNCFVSGTAVSGRFEGGLVAKYAGEIVEIRTKSGRVLAVTPNHPIVTRGGLRPAKELRKGEDLIRDLRWVEPVSTLRGVNEDHAPTFIDKVLGALREQRPSLRSAASSGDLHGDAEFVQGHVDVVRPDWKLTGHPLVASAKFLCERHLIQAAMQHAFVAGLGLSQLGLEGNHAAPTSLPGARELLPYAVRMLLDQGPLHPLRIGPASDVSTVLTEHALHGSTTNPAFFSELLHGNAGRVALDEITNVRSYPLRGHVYDLQSPLGWIVAEGLYVSNCRCAVSAWRSDWAT